MRGIVASVAFLLALCSVARAAESTTSNSSADMDTKSKTEGHAHATPEESPKALEAIPTSPTVKSSGHHSWGRPGGHGARDDDGDDDDGDGDGGE